MRCPLLRLLIALVLALAIPIQGFAALSAGLCVSAAHHAQDAAPHVQQHHAGAEAHDHADGHAHPHDAPAEGGDSAHCPPCVVCCTAASISPAAPLFLADDSPHPAIAVRTFPPPAFLPETLDRPPLNR